MREIETRLKRLEKRKIKGVTLLAINRDGEREITPADAVSMFEYALKNSHPLTVLHPDQDRTPDFSVLDAIDYNLLQDCEERLANEAELERRIESVIRKRFEKEIRAMTYKPLDSFLTPEQCEKAKQITRIEYNLLLPDELYCKYTNGTLYNALENMIHGKTSEISTTFDIFFTDNNDE